MHSLLREHLLGIRKAAADHQEPAIQHWAERLLDIPGGIAAADLPPLKPPPKAKKRRPRKKGA